MSGSEVTDDDDADAEARARAWHHGWQAAVCDRIEPWEHGHVLRATRYPDYYDLNVVRAEDDPGMSAAELMAVADQALAEFEHRKVDFDRIDPAERVRAGFESAGWELTRLLWMRHEAPIPPQPALPPPSELDVEPVPYDAVAELRVRWNREEFPDLDTAGFQVQARELALAQDVQVLAVLEEGAPVAFSQLRRDRGSAEITHVYVAPERRGKQMGTALTCAAIAAAGEAEDLWIVADDEDRPKKLYARLGFRPAWTSMEFMRLPT